MSDMVRLIFSSTSSELRRVFCSQHGYVTVDVPRAEAEARLKAHVREDHGGYNQAEPAPFWRAD